MIYAVSILVFLGVVLSLVGMLLMVEARVAVKGSRKLVINDDEEKTLDVAVGKTLLASLHDGGVLLSSACGGKGTCGTCKCRLDAGGGDILPTELSLVSRKERMDSVRLACQVKVKEDMRVRIPESIFNVRKLSATVVSNDNVATFIKELVLQLDAGQELEFKAGAFIQIDIPEYQTEFTGFNIGQQYLAAWKQFNLLSLSAGTDVPVNRAYSLANAPSEKGILRFTIRIATPPPGQSAAPPGVGSSYVFHLKPDDRVQLSGPYGDFFIRETEREMCFIGGGAGMAPLRSQIRNQLLDLNSPRKMTFWYGARSRSEIFFEEEFAQLMERFPNFSFHIALSDPQPEDHWQGPTGFIHQVAHDEYLDRHDDPTEIEYYLCGPPMMTAAVERMLDNLGVEPEMIAFDNFG